MPMTLKAVIYGQRSRAVISEIIIKNISSKAPYWKWAYGYICLGTGSSPRQAAEQSVSSKSPDIVAFSISMYLEMTDHVIFDQPYDSGERPPHISATRRSFSRNLAVSLERLIFTLFHPPLCPLPAPNGRPQESLWQLAEMMGIFCPKSLRHGHSGKACPAAILFLPGVLPDWWRLRCFIIGMYAKDITAKPIVHLLKTSCLPRRHHIARIRLTTSPDFRARRVPAVMIDAASRMAETSGVVTTQGGPSRSTMAL